MKRSRRDLNSQAIFVSNPIMDQWNQESSYPFSRAGDGHKKVSFTNCERDHLAKEKHEHIGTIKEKKKYNREKNDLKQIAETLKKVLRDKWNKSTFIHSHSKI